MSELERIASLLHRAHGQDPWHGPSRKLVLDGVTARQAAFRPLACAHSIWEIVLHSTAWAREVTRRLRGHAPAPPEGGDWPLVPDAPEDALWARTLADLDQAHAALIESILAFDAGRLDERVGDERDPSLGTGVTWYEMLHGLVHHEIYHTGQISLLKQGLTEVVEFGHGQAQSP